MPILRHSAVPCSVFDISLPDDGIGTQQLVFVSGIEVSGTRQIPVVPEEELEIMVELPDTTSVWPTLRERDGGNDNDNNILEDIVVTLTKNEEPVADRSIFVIPERIEGTGGHDHEINGDSPPQDSLGIFTHDNQDTFGELNAETDENGEVEFDYTSSRFSGELVLKAGVVVNSDTLFARDTLTIKVPGLVPLGEDTLYVLSGGTCAHHGPERPGNPIPARCESPDQIHYITETAKDSLVAAAEQYLDGEWNTENEKIRVNDISLLLGGYFDINGNWEGDHVSHRVGKDVDIENLTDVDKLKKAFSRNGWEYIQHNTTGFFPHFRLKED